MFDFFIKRYYELKYGFKYANMFKLMKDDTMTATIIETPTGYVLEDKSGLPIATYSRRRDAVRGASRKGFTVAA